jgi:DNA-binding protein H-NS
MPKSRTAPHELANLPLEELIALRGRIERLIIQKAESEKKALLEKLETIRRFEASANSSVRQKDRAKATPKYRNPETGETWAGRGVQPKWLRKAIEAGHTLEQFLIRPAATPPVKRP